MTSVIITAETEDLAQELIGKAKDVPGTVLFDVSFEDHDGGVKASCKSNTPDHGLQNVFTHIAGAEITRSSTPVFGKSTFEVSYKMPKAEVKG